MKKFLVGLFLILATAANAQAPGSICATSLPNTTSYNRICIGATQSGGGILSVDTFGGATADLQFQLNGAAAPTGISYNSTSHNLFIGPSGNATLTGTFNTSAGPGALGVLTTGSQNSAFGYNVLAATTTGASNTGIGFEALQTNTTGGANVAVGPSSLLVNTTGSNNVAVGVNALSANTAYAVPANKMVIFACGIDGKWFTNLTA